MQCPNPHCGKILPAHIRYCPYCGALVAPQPRALLREQGWALWFWWVLANAVGWAVSIAMGEDVFGIVLGPVVGVAQWLVLRRHIQKAGWWVLASVVGWPVALAVGFALGDLPIWVLFAVLGTVFGIAQRLVLRRQIRKAGWWVLASAVGWGMAVMTQRIAVDQIVGVGMAGAVVGAITGIALVSVDPRFRLRKSPMRLSRQIYLDCQAFFASQSVSQDFRSLTATKIWIY